MSEENDFNNKLSINLLQKVSITSAITLAIGQWNLKQFYQSYHRQLPQELYLIQIQIQNQQWILVKTDKECKQLINKLLLTQLSPQRIVQKIQDAFKHMNPFNKNRSSSNQVDLIEQLIQISNKKNIIENKIFSDFIQYTNIFERYIYRKFTMFKKNGGRHKQSCCKIGSLFSQWKKRQVNVQYNGITYKNQFGQMKQYLPFSHGFQFFYGKAQTDSKLGIILVSNHRRLILQAQTVQDYILFLYLIRKKTAQSPYININRFNSFAPIRQNVQSQYYIDGKEYFDAVSQGLKRAKKSIFITGWMLSPQFLIERGQNNTNKLTILEAIAARVKQGVQVNILLYHESSFLTNDSQYAKIKFQSLGNKVKVLRHPTDKLPVLWSHHSKMIIIDKSQAFFGGLDLCYGRYDDNKHQIFIQKHHINNKYPGIEYNNCRIKDIDNVRNYNIDHIDKRLPRLPWHDICQSVKGSIVSDFVHHFVEIWNFASYQNREVLNKDLLNNPTEHQFKTINNIISSKSSEIDIVNDYKTQNQKKKNKILNVLSNKLQQVKTKSRQSITVWKSKLYPEKKKKLEELYRKAKSPTDVNQFQNYLAALEKQIELEEKSNNNNNSLQKKVEHNFKKKTTFELKYNQKQNIQNTQHDKSTKKDQKSQQNTSNQINNNKNKPVKKSIFSNKPSININNNNNNNNNQSTKQKQSKILTELKQQQQTSKVLAIEQNNKNDENYIKFLKNLQIKGQQIKVELDEDIDSQQQAPAKIWQNKPYQTNIQNIGSDQCQLLRSVGNWSIGCSSQKTQFSIHLSYLQLISQSKHFIYIQNQFFISSTHLTQSVKNQICGALFRRIKLAVMKKQQFKIYVMLPLLPAFAGDLQNNDCTMLRMIMNWHYLSIKGLMQKIKQLNVEPNDYIQFLGLRTYGINHQNIPQTQIIYVHSKLMIIDDKITICGSANLNDRSLLGDRDSEIAVVNNGEDQIISKMAGVNVIVSEKVKNFRIKLWKEHFQLDQKILDDPISHDLWSKIKFLSQNNTKIYRKLFGCYPDNQMKTLADLKSIKQKAVIKQLISQTKQIHGNVVQYPYQFLQNQPIQSSVVSKEYYIPTECLT